MKLTCDVKSDKVKVTFGKGVLTVKLPKFPDARGKTMKIAIKNGK